MVRGMLVSIVREGRSVRGEGWKFEGEARRMVMVGKSAEKSNHLILNNYISNL
jgi:hypothetical protein